VDFFLDLLKVKCSCSPILTTLHWLPMCKRVMFKTVVLVRRCLNGTALGHLSELCVFVASASSRQHPIMCLVGRKALLNQSIPGQPWWAYYKFPEPEPWSASVASLSRNHLYGDQRWRRTLSSDNSRPICSTSDRSINRRNIHCHPALLWRFSWF